MVGALLCVGCGEVVKATPDATVQVDAVLDAPACTGTPPDATFQFVPGFASVNQPVTFTPTATGLAYAWTFENGTPHTSTDESPTVTWMSALANVVSLTVTDSASHCSATSMQTINSGACQPALNCPNAFPNNTGGHADSGITIVAKVNTTLTSFKVMNQGKADTLKLIDVNGTVLQTATMPAGSANPYTVTVSWPLTANAKYRLTTLDPSNNQYANITAGQFPTQNGSLSVPAGWMDGAEQPTYWFGFTELVTCP